MNADELAAAIGRSITGILDTVGTFTAEQVALAVVPQKATGEPETDLDEPYAGALARIRELENLTADILARFTDHGHPGQVAKRTGWVGMQTLEYWQACLSRLAVYKAAGIYDRPRAGGKMF